MAEQEALKRPRDELTAATGAGDETNKRAKVEAAAISPAEENKVTDGATSGAGATPGDVVKEEAMEEADPPVTIMYKTFNEATDCKNYYTRLLAQLRQNQNLNEYEHNMVLGLLRKGHPDPPRKIGGGIAAIQVRQVHMGDAPTNAFFIVHTDGSVDDFSTRKCIAKLFPTAASAMLKAPGNQAGQGRGQQRSAGGRGSSSQGRFRGRGRGGPGAGNRGGPGRGRGGIPNRGGRGRGPRGRGRRGRF